MMLSMWIAAFFLALVTINPVVLGWNIDISIIIQAGGAFGGEPFLTQPIVTVNNRKGELQSSFEGRVSVQSNASPNGKYEPVWKNGESVPTEDANTFISETVVGGRAVFSGLGIDVAGDGYQLKFVLYDEYGIIMGAVVGETFSVNVGERYKLGLVVPPEMANGGSVFQSQPVLAIQDRGGNTVIDVNDGTVCWFGRLCMLQPTFLVIPNSHGNKHLASHNRLQCSCTAVLMAQHCNANIMKGLAYLWQI